MHRRQPPIGPWQRPSTPSAGLEPVASPGGTHGTPPTAAGTGRAGRGLPVLKPSGASAGRWLPAIASMILAAVLGWAAGLGWDHLAGQPAANSPFPRSLPTALAAEPVHVVQPGETLYRIARRYGLTVDELARYNRLADPTRIITGQRLRLPATVAGGGDRQQAAGKEGAPSAEAPGSGGRGPAGAEGSDGWAAGGIVALTFDDGPDPATWPTLLSALDQAGAKATFFLEGARVQQHPDLAREAVRRGHQVENHGWSHRSPAELGERATREEIRRTAQLIQRLTGRRPLYYRPPGGFRDPAVFQWAGAERHRVLLWTNIAAPDVPAPPADQLAARLASGAYHGAILMLHATEPATARALPAVLEALHRRGLRPVTVNQLMNALSQSAAGQPTPSDGGDH